MNGTSIKFLAGKTAIVTGSTSGIGLAIADCLARVGCNIVLNGFGNEAETEAIRQRIESTHGVAVIYIEADMRKPAEIRRMVERTADQFGAIDVLINNAGIQFVAAVEDFPVDQWDDIIAVNLSAAFHAMRAVIPLMRKQPMGRIINIASAHALVASPYKSAYVAAKHGLMGLTKTVALELAEADITVNSICPGYVKTALVDRQIADTARVRGMSEEAVINDVILNAQPSKQFVTTEQIAEAVLFLCSEAASQITGTSLSMDGGWTAQ